MNRGPRTVALSRPASALPLPLILIALIGVHNVSAQITCNATCLSTWEKLYNSKGQSPCLVGAYLGGTCNGGQYDVNMLTEGTYYIGPVGELRNECRCSKVWYNVMAGCSACMNTKIISWTDWSSDCGDFKGDSFPKDIPQDTAVPGWAYVDPKGGTFDPSQAIEDNSPESTATSLLSTGSATSADSSASPTASSGDSTSSSTSSSKSNIGAIAGGVVAGVKNAHKVVPVNGVRANLTGGPSTSRGASGGGGGHRTTPVPYTPNVYEHIDSSGAVGGGMGMGNPPMMAQQRMYDPNDPTTFPKAPLPGSIHGQNTDQAYTPNFPQSNPSGGVPNQGAYRGIAEIYRA